MDEIMSEGIDGV